MPSILTRSLLSAASVALLHASAIAGEAAVPEPSGAVVMEEKIVNGFVHPGIGITKEMFEQARTAVLTKQEPWYSGYVQLTQHRFSGREIRARNESLVNPGHPDSDALDSQGMEMRLSQDGARAVRQAMMYFFTGDNVYRANALRILRVWSRMDPKKIKPYPDAHIHAGLPLKDFIQAAEILRCTVCEDRSLQWTEEDDRRFTRNLVLPAIDVLMDSNGWFMNQNNFAIAGAMAGFIFANDRERYNQRVEWFTVNRSAPNQGWNASIQQLARRVEINALTGEKLAVPVVQLAEMGRDQAHGAEDINLFVTISRMMMAQRTRVDPVTGAASTRDNAVGPYEFLDDRILAAADHFCQFMLGYETPWVPLAYDIGPDGGTRRIYPRISDQYRGRFTTFAFWDLYFYYTHARGISLKERAPFFHEAYEKRITPLDWLMLPKEAAGLPLVRNPAVPDRVEIEARATLLSEGIQRQSDAETSYLRIPARPEGARIALLSSATRSETFGLRIRTNGQAELRLSGFSKPIHLPDTGGEWAHVTHTGERFETFIDIVYFEIRGTTGITVDLDAFLPDAKQSLSSPVFVSGMAPLRRVSFVGAPIQLDFTATDPSAGGSLFYSASGMPDGAVLSSANGRFTWTPERAVNADFRIFVTDGETIASRPVSLVVAADRDAAVASILQARVQDRSYVTRTVTAVESAASVALDQVNRMDDAAFLKCLDTLQCAADGLQLLTPLLSDGSVDFPRTVADSDIGDAIALLVDGNDDTFPVHTLAKDRNYQFDFGADFRFSATAFEIEGRLNFEERVEKTVFYGSDDKKKWVQLTAKPTELSTGRVRVEVIPTEAKRKFRFLSIQKTTGGLLEAGELRIIGERHEN